VPPRKKDELTKIKSTYLLSQVQIGPDITQDVFISKEHAPNFKDFQQFNLLLGRCGFLPN